MMAIQDNSPETVRQTIIETVSDFNLVAPADDGGHIGVPVGYQISEPGFRPYRAGKASPQELQEELDKIIRESDERGIDLGIEGQDSLRKLSIQMGLGVDCSNFVYRVLAVVHDRLGLTPYEQTVFRKGEDIRNLHESKKPSWDAKDEEGKPRNLIPEEQERLQAADLLDIDWIAKVFGKDPEFIMGSVHIAAENSTQQVAAIDILPGDIISFLKAGKGIVSHVGVVEQSMVEKGIVTADFWHSWHSRDFEAGVRRDSVTIEPDGTTILSHPGLDDPSRYEGYGFRRPSELAVAYSL